MGFRASKKAAAAQEAAYRAQAANYLRQSDILLGAAKAQAGAAKYAVKAGKANAAMERKMASYVQNDEDLALQAEAKERRAKIGEGRTAFAANGVLVDQGAAALWEQDEAADAAIERLQIMESAESQIYGRLVAAQSKLAEGYGNAGAAYSPAAQTAMSAYSAALSAQGALQGAANVQGPSATALALNIAGSVAGAAGQIYGANAATTPTKAKTDPLVGRHQTMLDSGLRSTGNGGSGISMAPIQI